MTPTKSVLVTGASRGIGEATAYRLVGAGFRVFAGVRHDDDAERLRAASDRIRPLRLDLTDAGHIAEAARTVAGEVGDHGLDGLVNNAGISIAGPLEFLPVDELRRQLEVNVVGQVAVTRALLPLLRLARGRIVFVGSIAGTSTLPFVGAYSASKHALEAIADAWRVELEPWGIDVALVRPGAVATDIWKTALALAERTLAQQGPALERLYGARIAAARKGALEAESGGIPPDAVARAVAHALTAPRPKARYVVGRDAMARQLLQLLPDRMRDGLIRRQLDKLEE